MAHADDEIIFGYPYLQQRDHTRSLLVCSTDRSRLNPRVPTLQGICDDLDIGLHLFEAESGFYKLEPAPLRDFCKGVGDLIASLAPNFDLVFTHNPHGEYGHHDHRLIFDVVSSAAPRPIVYTDIRIENGWHLPPVNPLYYRHRIGEATLDADLYRRCRDAYRRAKSWTWIEETSPACRLFRMPDRRSARDRCW